jgi:hypothetical protein
MSTRLPSSLNSLAATGLAATGELGLMLADWLALVRAGGHAPIGAAEGLRALEIISRAYRSAELHALVSVGRQPSID